MSRAEQVKALVRSFLRNDSEMFMSVTRQIAANEQRQGHNRIAKELNQLLESAQELSFNQKSKNNFVRISKPRGELSEFLNVSYPDHRLSEIVLSEDALLRIERVLLEQSHYEKLRAHSLNPCRKILLVGPPGTGKTLTASVLASQLKLPLFIVRLEQIITKYMGETSAKLQLVFESMNNMRGIYFFDEFDAIGWQRNSRNDVGEARRILNSFLQFIENDNSDSLIIAATNHAKSLDSALHRRFEEIIKYDLPTGTMVRELIINRLANFDKEDINFDRVVTESEGLSCADIVMACDDAAKVMIINESSCISERELLESIKRRKTNKW